MSIHPSQGFFIFGFGFCLAVFVGLLFSDALVLFVVLVVSATFFVWVFFRCFRKYLGIDFSVTVFFLAYGILCVGIFFGFLRIVFEQTPLDTHVLLRQDLMSFEGTVLDVDQRINHTRLLIHAPAFASRVLVTTVLYPEYKVGDLLQLQCHLQQPSPMSSFRYDRFLASQNIHWTCYYPRISWVGQGAVPRYFIFSSYKTQLLYRVNRILPEPFASLFAGLLLGVRRGFPQELSDVFQRTGTSHVMAISGYNVSLVSTFLLSLAVWLGLPRKKALIVAGVSIVFFILFVGASASVIRAGLMALLVLLARYIARPTASRQIFMLVAFLVALFRPAFFVYDIGFHLSFLATLGLVYLAPCFEKILHNAPEQWGLRENASATLSALSATLPLTVFQFHGISLVAFIANILILPVIPLVMFFGTLAMIFGFLHQFLTTIVLWPAWLLLAYMLFIVERLSIWSWAYFATPLFPWQFVFVGYGVLGYCFVRFPKFFQ